MPKTRAYTREELQGLRRADLQRLCKTYDIKGANAKSEVLIDLLTQYFVSPAYLASPRPATRTRPAHARLNLTNRPLHTLPGRNTKPRAATASSTSTVTSTRLATRTRPEPAASAAAAPAEAPAVPAAVDKGKRVAKPAAAGAAGTSKTRGSVETANNEEQVEMSDKSITKSPAKADAADNSITQSPTNSAELAALQSEVAQLKETVARWEQQHEDVIIKLVETKVEAKVDQLIQRQLALLDKREAALQLREQALDAAWAQLSRRLADAGATVPTISMTESHNDAAASSSARRSKRKQSDIVESPAKRTRLGDASPHTPDPGLAPLAPLAVADAHRDSTMAVDPITPAAQMSSLPSSDAANVPPHTPSPNHQGVAPDNSKTPVITADEGSNSPSSASRPPAFATTPKPVCQPMSPTPERPENFLRHDGPPHLLTPVARSARRRPERTARRVSQAHIELSSITDSDEPIPEPSSATRRQFHGSIFIADRARAVTPPALSPSPSIGGDNFTYTPLPKPPARPSGLTAMNNTAARVPSSPTPERNVATRGGAIVGAGAEGANFSPAPFRVPGHARRFSSPGREYMDVALNGLNPHYSPSALATPGSRTILGTERYRDTRFGDEPMSWHSPTVDLGSTPN